LAAEQATSAQLRASLSEQHQLVASLRLELAAIGERLVAALAECARQATELDCRQAEVQQKSANIETLEAKIRNDEQARKRLHNTIQELKGNIRVYARLRPPMVNEVVSEEVQFVCVPDTDYRQLEVCGASQKSADGLKTQQKRWQFEFDRVFGQEATQADVFEELSQLIQSSLDGYKVSIMSYGQTGSGKTFTMEGPTIDCKNDNAGMIPRAVEQIFDYCTALKSKGWNYSLEAMYVEIYNENIIDLLSAQADTEEGKHEIKHFAGGPAAKQETVVTGVVLQPVTCAGDVYPLLQRAKANRSGLLFSR
jgi:kinesin family protein C1